VTKRNLALIALAVAIIIETVWLATEKAEPHGFAFYSVTAFDVLFAALLIAGGRLRWLAGVLRIAIGLNFGLAVLDRFGVLGAYGSPAVSWGDWGHFVVYTRQVNAFLPESVAPALALAATVYEIVLSVTLVLGIRTRVFLVAAAILLFLYGTAMTLSFGFASQLAYGVIVLFAGSLLLSTVDSTFLSIDSLLQKRLRTTRVV